MVFFDMTKAPGEDAIDGINLDRCLKSFDNFTMYG
jgi:hypothetical protein